MGKIYFLPIAVVILMEILLSQTATTTQANSKCYTNKTCACPNPEDFVKFAKDIVKSGNNPKINASKSEVVERVVGLPEQKPLPKKDDEKEYGWDQWGIQQVCYSVFFKAYLTAVKASGQKGDVRTFALKKLGVKDLENCTFPEEMKKAGDFLGTQNLTKFKTREENRNGFEQLFERMGNETGVTTDKFQDVAQEEPNCEGLFFQYYRRSLKVNGNSEKQINLNIMNIHPHEGYLPDVD